MSTYNIIINVSYTTIFRKRIVCNSMHVWYHMSAAYKNADSYLIICTNFFPNTEQMFDRVSQMLHRGSGYYYYSRQIVEHFVIFHFAGSFIKSKIHIIILTLILWKTIRTLVAGSFLWVLLMIWCIRHVAASLRREIVICADGIRKKLLFNWRFGRYLYVKQETWR